MFSTEANMINRMKVVSFIKIDSKYSNKLKFVNAIYTNVYEYTNIYLIM